MSDYITIKDVKARTGVSDHALRYYEKAGLLPRVVRTSNGRRQYTDQDVAWIDTIKLLRSTGMPIRKIAHLAQLRSAGDASIEARIAYFEAYKKELTEQIALRHQAIQTIDKKIERHHAMLRARDAKE